MKWSKSCVVVAAVVAVMLLLGDGGKLSYASTVDPNDSDLKLSFPDQTDLSLDAPPIKRVAADPGSDIIVKEQALIPLPPAAWTGLTGLAALGLGSSFRAVRRFIIR